MSPISAGLRKEGSVWTVEESGTHEMLECMQHGGYPVSGLFYLSRPSQEGIPVLRAVFIKGERERTVARET